MTTEKVSRIVVPDDFLDRLQLWIDEKRTNAKQPVRIRRGRGNLSWREITPAQALDALLTEAGF